jgi:hypothetical protein
MTAIASLRTRLRRLEQRSPAEPLIVFCRSFVGCCGEPVRIEGAPGVWSREDRESTAEFRARVAAACKASPASIVSLSEVNAA